MKNSAILLISCPDLKGEVATIADFVGTVEISCIPTSTPTRSRGYF
jgi:formyltetrahydrofolate hydrolase